MNIVTAGLIRVNGVEKTTTATSGAVTFGSLFLNQTSYNFDGEISKLQIANVRLSAAQIQSLYNFTRLQHPEIEGVAIGNQFWATSNYEGVVTGNGTVIPEVQGASTATNPELIGNSQFNDTTWWQLNLLPTDMSFTSVGGIGKIGVSASTGTKYPGIAKPDICSVGKRYFYNIVVRGDGTQIPRMSIGGVSINGTASTTWQTMSGEITATAAGLLLYFVITNPTGSEYVEVDSFSVKEVGWSDLTTPAWCYYNNDPLNGAVYGKKYNGYAAQAIAANPPEGWRVPTDADFNQLKTYLGSTDYRVYSSKLSKEGLKYWSLAYGTNETGFSAIPSGIRIQDGTFADINNVATIGNGTSVLQISNSTTSTWAFQAARGFPIRLIRNEPVGATERTIETGYITNALGVTNLDISIPFGYQVESIRFDSETDITGLSAKLLTGALVELETLFTAKSVTANVQKVIAADADQSIQQTDSVVRINGTKDDTTKRFRVWIKLTKVIFS